MSLLSGHFIQFRGGLGLRDPIPVLIFTIDPLMLRAGLVNILEVSLMNIFFDIKSSPAHEVKYKRLIASVKLNILSMILSDFYS